MVMNLIFYKRSDFLSDLVFLRRMLFLGVSYPPTEEFILDLMHYVICDPVVYFVYLW